MTTFALDGIISYLPVGVIILMATAFIVASVPSMRFPGAPRVRFVHWPGALPLLAELRLCATSLSAFTKHSAMFSANCRSTLVLPSHSPAQARAQHRCLPPEIGGDSW